MTKDILSRGPRRSRTEWQRLVEELESGDESHDTFAARHGLHVGSLRSWLYRIRRSRRQTSAPKPPVSFVAVEAPRPLHGYVELVGAGVVLRVDGALGPSYIAALARELTSQC